jgi:erythromycin esterase-like protein
MDAIARAVDGRRIVAVGEATHGAHEFFAFKAALFEYLVEHDGFTVLAIEGAARQWRPMDAYVHGGAGNAAVLLRGQDFTMYRVAEMRDLLTWIRRYNETAGKRSLPQVSIAGIYSESSTPVSMNQHDELLAQHVEDLADNRYPQAKIFVWAHDGHVALADASAPWWHTMGQRLRERYGDRYYAIGTVFHRGTIRARPAFGAAPAAVEIPATADDSLGAALAAAQQPLFLNLRDLAPDSPLAQFLSRPQQLWMPGGIVTPAHPYPSGLTRIVPAESFDSLVFVPSVHASTGL